MHTIIFDNRDLHYAFCHEQGVLLRPDTSTARSIQMGEHTRSPYGEVGQQMWVQERLWVSECGCYYAQCAPVPRESIAVDVMTVDGNQWWFWDRYVPTGWDDPDPRYRYPEFAHMVGAWLNWSRMTGTGRCLFAFEVDFVDCDTAQLIQPFKGNTVLHSYQAVFRRQLPGHRMPEWARRLAIEITQIAEIPLCHVPATVATFAQLRERYGNVQRLQNSLMWQIS